MKMSQQNILKIFLLKKNADYETNRIIRGQLVMNECEKSIHPE